jgi:hypothetical protein
MPSKEAPQHRFRVRLPAHGQQQGVVTGLEGAACRIFERNPALHVGVGRKIRRPGEPGALGPQPPGALVGGAPEDAGRASEAVTPWARQRRQAGERWVMSMICMRGDSVKAGRTTPPTGQARPVG